MIAAALSVLLLASAKGAVAVLAVLALRAAAGRRLPPRWIVALWLVAALRLVLPVGPQSGWSVFGGEALAGASRLGPWIGSEAPVEARPGESGGTVFPAADLSGRLRALAEGLAGLLRPSPTAAAAVGLLWAAGVLVALARGARDRRRLAALRARARAVHEPAALEALAACRRAVGLRREVILAESEEVAGPALCPGRAGRAALVLLPPGAAASLAPERLRHVLLHELAHLAHRDLEARRVARALCAVHWFNPLVHLAARVLAADQEVAADARAMTVLGRSRRDAYARTLLALLPSSAAPAHAAPVAFSTDRRHLHRRIAMIASFRPRRRGPALAIAAAAFVLISAALLTDGATAGPDDRADAATATTPSAAAPDTSDPQVRTLLELRTIGKAMWEWVADQPGVEAPESHDPDTPFDWSRCPSISHDELAALLVPGYAETLPETDPWGRPYELCLDGEASAPNYRIGVRSAGSDGRFDGETYVPGPFAPERTAEDVVWIDGFFVRWPEEGAGTTH